MRRRRQAGVLLADLSRLSHRLVGRHRTGADGLDIQWILTCGYGFWRADWTCGVGLRIRRPGGADAMAAALALW
jgi:hypothetical protein